MMSAPNDSSLSLNQDSNRILMWTEIKPQISYSTIKNFTSWVNWNSRILCDCEAKIEFLRELVRMVWC